MSIAKLIKDLGMKFPTETVKRKRRYGLYECVNCKEHFESRSDSGSTYCSNCHNAWKKLPIEQHKQPHKLHQTWAHELHRCTNKNSRQYIRYGGRGIKVSKEFKDFKTWLQYVESLPNAYKTGHTVDRIDNDKDYERGNIRWASKSIQAQNTVVLCKANTTGYRGVYAEHGKYRARIMVGNVSTTLGTCSDILDAAKLYDGYIFLNGLEHNGNGTVDGLSQEGIIQLIESIKLKNKPGNKYIVTHRDGTIEQVTRLNDYCKKNNLSIKVLRKWMNKGIILSTRAGQSTQTQNCQGLQITSNMG